MHEYVKKYKTNRYLSIIAFSWQLCVCNWQYVDIRDRT